jgi:hypothetical protein
MSRFREYTELDDQHLTDGDRGFFRMVTRQRGERLQAGEVAMSQNGRMETDGNWQVRDGVAVVSPNIEFDGNPLILPFTLDDGGTPPVLDDLGVAAVYGSAVFSDPVTDVEYVVVLINSFALLVNITTKETVRLPYPVGVTLNAGVDGLQVFDKFRVFRGPNAVSIEWDGELKQVTDIDEAARLTDIVTITTLSPHGLTTGDTVLIQGIVPDDGDPNGVYSITVGSPTTFFYSSAGGDVPSFDVTAAVATRGFYAIPSGTYTQPKILTAGSNTVIGTNGTAVVTETNHGLETGDKVRIITHSGGADFFNGQLYTVKVTGADTFEYQAEADTGTFSVVYTKPQSIGGGYIHQPNASWGVVAQGRLIVPYEVNNNDELIFSDIFDANTFDPIFNQFRPSGGTADFLVAVYPWVDDRVLVLNRRSVHVINGTSGSLLDTQVREITREFGCIARQSIAQVGDNIMWLSDNGVMQVNTTTEYNQLAVAVPLSEPIQDLFTRVNWVAADKACAAYFNNRYYLALPIDGSTGNNAILVYNFLNQGWESLDTFDPKFGLNIVSLFAARQANRLRLFFTTDQGAIHIYEESDKLDSVAGAQNEDASTAPIDGVLVTRSLFLGDNEIKRFSRTEVKVLGPAFVPAVAVQLDSPTSEASIGDSYTIGEGRESLRIRVARRGYSMAVKLSAGYGAVESVVSEAYVANRSTRTR